LGSTNLTSCAPAPVCQSSTYTFSDTTRIQTLANYNGDASTYGMLIQGLLSIRAFPLCHFHCVDWVLTGGNYTTVNNSLALSLTQTNGGTRLASTKYVHYGSISASSKQLRISIVMLTLTGIVSIVKSGRWPGVVTAFITMSDIRDEIDWECECLLFDFRHPSSKRTPRARK
jgi:hypothetical protein